MPGYLLLQLSFLGKNNKYGTKPVRGSLPSDAYSAITSIV